MPRRDGTGPLGQGAGTGRGLSNGPPGRGSGGYCICPQCGMKAAHEQAIPCASAKCPKCGTPMARE